MQLIEEITIDNIPSYYVVGNKKRYTSMNLFYSNTHWSVRKGIVDKSKDSLKVNIDKKIFNLKVDDIYIAYEYTSKKSSFDIENRLGFWSKVFLDYAKGTTMIPDDNVKTIKKISYDYVHTTSPTDKLKISIYGIPSKRCTDERKETSTKGRASSKPRSSRNK